MFTFYYLTDNGHGVATCFIFRNVAFDEYLNCLDDDGCAAEEIVQGNAIPDFIRAKMQQHPGDSYLYFQSGDEEAQLVGRLNGVDVIENHLYCLGDGVDHETEALIEKIKQLKGVPKASQESAASSESTWTPSDYHSQDRDPSAGGLTRSSTGTTGTWSPPPSLSQTPSFAQSSARLVGRAAAEEKGATHEKNSTAAAAPVSLVGAPGASGGK